MSSHFKGFYNTLIEALAHSLPAVSFYCDTGPRDIIRNEVDGLLTPTDNVQSLEKILHRLMSDNALRLQLGTKAVEVRKLFSMSHIHENLGPTILKISIVFPLYLLQTSIALALFVESISVNNWIFRDESE